MEPAVIFANGLHEVYGSLQTAYSTSSTSEDSRFLFEFEFTAATISSKKTRSQRPQEPKQRKARIDEPRRLLRVKDNNWQPCKKTRLTVVEVATSSPLVS